MKNIVIADHSKPNVVIISEILKDRYEDISIKMAMNAKEILYYVRNEPIDMVILEFLQPDMDGVEIVKRIKKVSNIPVIFTTIENDEFYNRFNQELFHFQDCAEVQIKPIHSDKFISIIDRYLTKTGRIEKRFDTDKPISFYVKHRRSRKKKQMQGVLKNISMSGFCLGEIEIPLVGSEETIGFEVDKLHPRSKKVTEGQLLIKGKVLWVNKKTGEMGGKLMASSGADRKRLLSQLKDLFKFDNLVPVNKETTSTTSV